MVMFTDRKAWIALVNSWRKAIGLEPIKEEDE